MQEILATASSERHRKAFSMKGKELSTGLIVARDREFTFHDLGTLEVSRRLSRDLGLALSEALDLFAAQEPRQPELVKLRDFVGLKIEEAAEVLGISEATAKRWWVYARAWLYETIQSDGSCPRAFAPRPNPAKPV
jgi:DNA-directed RNA polymerase specialized sigma24 family protein